MAGGLNALANLLCKTNSANALVVTLSGGSASATTMTVDSLIFNIANPDATFSRSAAGAIALTAAGTATTSTNGLALINSTAATALATVQISRRLLWRGHAWDTSASQTVDFFAENLPATAATPTGTWKLGYSLNGAAATYPLTVSSAGVITSLGGVSAVGTILANQTTAALQIASRLSIQGSADAKITLTDFGTGALGVGLDFATDGILKVRNRAQNADAAITASTGTFSGAIAAAGNITSAGTVGVPVVAAYGDVAAATNTGTASIATVTPAVDTTYEVSANCLVTTSTNHSFSLDVTYTDESNVARTMVLPVVALAGTFLTTGLITNVTGAGPYETPAMTIRAKASTAVTVRTSAGGTFTTVVYNARGVIKQVS